MIAIYTGLPGSGKSAMLSRTVIDLLYRNQKWYSRQMRLWNQNKRKGAQPVPRMLWTNLKLNPRVEQHFEGWFTYWTDLRQLTPLRDVDVIIDEVATYFDARLWPTLSLEMRRWLAQHRKFGIEIYGTAQDFAQCDIAFRRLTSDLAYLTKLIGTRDISPTRPPPRWVLVLSILKPLDPTRYDEQSSKFAGTSIIPRFKLITKKDVLTFDTRAEIALSKALPMKHIERVCELPSCPASRIQHV